ncbi:MAG: hypothetical protein ACFFCW_25560 [Candidatus Hodarchaeota archaeon]
MATVIHETENAIFQFDLADTIKCLSAYAIQGGVNEANDLLDFLTSSPTDPVRIPEGRSELFGYVTLDLLSQRKGSAYCKLCQKTYRANQLNPITIGHGKTPFSVKLKEKGGIRNLFARKGKMPGMFGGKGYECPEGHELIAMVTWRT